MKISIIIATYNRAKSLLRTLDSLVKQSADTSLWECIVVNNASTDDTAARFEEFAKAHPSLCLRMVNESQQGLSFARNRGIAESNADYLVFIDDDETVNEDFVQAYLDIFAGNNAFAAAGVVIPVYESGRPHWMSKYTEKMIANPIYLGEEVITISHTIMPAGGNMAFNRDMFKIYGNFNTQLGRVANQLLGGEENELFDRIRALGERVHYVPRAVVYHHISDDKLTPEYFDKLAYGVGVSKRRRAELSDSLNQLRADERIKWVGTVMLALFYALTLRPAKGSWLLRMRKGISKGIYEN